MTTATAVRTPPNHNTLTCYVDYRCRLPECVERQRTYDRQRREARANGTWNHLVDATEARNHVRALHAAGLAEHRIAALANTTDHTIHSLRVRSYAKGRGRQQRINRALAERILAITPDGHHPSRVPSTATNRRIEALAATGWPLAAIATHAGLTAKTMSAARNQKTVAFTTARAIARTYQDLRDTKPENAGVSPWNARRTRKWAQGQRWAPPAYWDDPEHPIGDPHFQSDYGVTKAEILAEDTRWLMRQGYTREQAALRLGKSRSYIDKVLNDHPDAGQAAA